MPTVIIRASSPRIAWPIIGPKWQSEEGIRNRHPQDITSLLEVITNACHNQYTRTHFARQQDARALTSSTHLETATWSGEMLPARDLVLVVGFPGVPATTTTVDRPPTCSGVDVLG